jgi:hypothetical protein
MGRGLRFCPQGFAFARSKALGSVPCCEKQVSGGGSWGAEQAFPGVPEKNNVVLFRIELAG